METDSSLRLTVENWFAHSLVKKIKIIIIICILFIQFFSFPRAVLAHIPHDYVIQVKSSPIYAQDKTVFIIVRNNLFRSIDGGDNWQRIVQGLDYKYSLSSLSISPDYARDKTVIVSSYGDGIYKSEDGGNSWFRVNNQLANLDINQVAFSPHNPQTILAVGTKQGLYLSSDGGNNWQEVLNENNQITAIAYALNDSNYIMAGNQQGNIYISRNGGTNWYQISSQTNNLGAITSLLISPDFATDNTVYIGTENQGVIKAEINNNSIQTISHNLSNKYIRDMTITPKSNQDYSVYVVTENDAVYQSSDRGKSWQKYSQGITKTSQADQLKYPHFYDLDISSTFLEDKTMFLGGFNGLFKSEDGGNSWQEIHTLSPRIILDLGVSPNYSNDSTLAVVTYLDEAYISTNKGETWQALNQGLEPPLFTRKFINEPHIKRFYQLLFSPDYAKDKTIFATLLWTKLLKYRHLTKSWQILPLPKEERSPTIAISPNFAKDNKIYTATQKGNIYISTNKGKKFSLLSTIPPKKGNQSPALAISPEFSSDQTMFASGEAGIYKTVDGGKTWKPVSSNTLLAKRYNLKLAISPNYQKDQTVIVGTSEGMFASKDGGENWFQVVVTDTEQDDYIQGVAISPDYQNDPTFLVSVIGKGLFKTEDGGNSFKNIGDNSIALAVMNNFENASTPIVFSPSYSEDQTIYAFGSANAEIFRSTDAGNTWQVLPIPRDPIFAAYQNNQYDFMTRLKLLFYLHQRKIVIVCLATLAALLSYLGLGRLLLRRKLPVSKIAIKMLASLIVFILVVFFLQFLL